MRLLRFVVALAVLALSVAVVLRKRATALWAPRPIEPVELASETKLVIYTDDDVPVPAADPDPLVEVEPVEATEPVPVVDEPVIETIAVVEEPAEVEPVLEPAAVLEPESVELEPVAVIVPEAVELAPVVDEPAAEAPAAEAEPVLEPVAVVPEPVPVPRAAPDDDLRRIRGIGPSIERTLHNLGIQTYEALAMLDEEGLHRVRATLQFPQRIDRENWIGQAADLYEEKYGERLVRPARQQ